MKPEEIEVRPHVDAEIAHHLEERIERLRAEGLSEAAARAEARRRFGDIETYRETMVGFGIEKERKMKRSRFLGGLVQDTRYAVRNWVRQPLHAAGVILTLAIGIGASAAIFSALDAVLLRPPPFAEPERLVDVWRAYPGGGLRQYLPPELAGPIAEHAAYLSARALHTWTNMTLGAVGEPREVMVRAVSPEFFDVVGRHPRLGRGLAPSDAVPGAPPVAVLAHDLWRSLGEGRDVLGSTIELDDVAYTVIGVMPPDFRFPVRYAAQVFLALPQDFMLAGREMPRIELLGRLQPGIAFEVADERAGLEARALPVADTASWTLKLYPLGMFRAHSAVTRGLWLAGAAVGLLLLIAVANATNLLLARSLTRSRELAVRRSLGASGARLGRQLLTESLLSALAAGVVAVAVAYVSVRALNAIAPFALAEGSVHAVTISQRVLLFVFAITIATALLVGAGPAVWVMRAAARNGLTATSVYDAAGRRRVHARNALVVMQVSFAVTLIALAGLLISSFARIMRVDTGFDTDRIVILSIYPNERRYPESAERLALARTLEERIAALPGVVGLTRTIDVPPQSGFSFGLELQTEHDAAPRTDSPPMLPVASVRPDFIPTLGVELVAGRNFEAHETDASDVVIIDASFARFLFPNSSALGARFRLDPHSPWLTVVGIVDRLMLGSPTGETGTFALLRPLSPDDAATTFAIRTAYDPARLLPLVRAAVREVDASQPIELLMSGPETIREGAERQEFLTLVMSALAALALGLSALGLYGVLSFVVQRRYREIGIRMALGARPQSIARMIYGSGVGLAVLGIILGIAMTAAAVRLVESLLFATEPFDPVTFAATCAVMLSATIAACTLPARRATRYDPLEVLRLE